MHLKVTLFLACLLLFQDWSFSETVIDLSIPINGEGKLLVYKTTDDIGGNDQLILSENASIRKHFKIKVDNDKVTKVYLYFRNYNCEFYIIPDAKYKITVSLEGITPPRHQFERISLYPIFEKQDDLNFNIQSDELSYKADSIVSNYVKKYGIRVPIQRLDSHLRATSLLIYDNQEMREFENYAKFNAVYSTSLRPAKIASEYFKNNGHTALEGNIFINQALNMIAKDFYSYLKESEKDSIYNAVNNGVDLLPYSNVIQQVLHVEDNNFNQLLLYKCLYFNSFQKNFNREQIIYHMKKLVNLDSNNFTRIAGENIIEKLTKLMKNNHAFSADIIDDKDTFELAVLFDKPVYLNFWNEKCEQCKEDMRVIQEISKQYKNVNFVSIYLGEFAKSQYSFLNAASIKNWTCAYPMDKWDFIRSYQVHALPLFYFINKGGRFILSPARGPYHRSLAILERLNKAHRTNPDYMDIREYDE